MFLFLAASVPAKIGNGLEGDLDIGESIRFQYQLPTDGMTIMMCIRQGNVVLYASTKITSPNSAFYEHKLDVSGKSSDDKVCDDVYIAIGPSSELKRELSSQQANITLYVSLNGEDEYNEFLLSTSGIAKDA